MAVSGKTIFLSALYLILVHHQPLNSQRPFIQTFILWMRAEVSLTDSCSNWVTGWTAAAKISDVWGGLCLVPSTFRVRCDEATDAMFQKSPTLLYFPSDCALKYHHWCFCTNSAIFKNQVLILKFPGHWWQIRENSSKSLRSDLPFLWAPVGCKVSITPTRGQQTFESLGISEGRSTSLWQFWICFGWTCTFASLRMTANWIAARVLKQYSAKRRPFRIIQIDLFCNFQSHGESLKTAYYSMSRSNRRSMKEYNDRHDWTRAMCKESQKLKVQLAVVCDLVCCNRLCDMWLQKESTNKIAKPIRPFVRWLSCPSCGCYS